MNGKPLSDKQIEGLDAGLTQGGNPSVLNKKKEKNYNTYPEAPKGTKQATPSNMVPGKP